MTDLRATDDLAVSLGDAAIEYLQALVRMDTTSPPGNERLATDYISGILSAEAIESTVVESAPTRANLVARLKADNPTGRPVMLMGHTDVVSVERDKWEHDPFGAEIIDGYMWGRGTLDMKNQVASQLAAFVALKRANLPLTRDVIFAAFADEEVSGELGAGWVYANHRDLIDAEFALNEGGGGQVQLLGTRSPSRFPPELRHIGACSGPPDHVSGQAGARLDADSRYGDGEAGDCAGAVAGVGAGAHDHRAGAGDAAGHRRCARR
jgi:acetylornithine deacetylase/succinyl-diaminopimelate desuccinylase-like protein